MGMRFAILLFALVGCAQSNSTICGKLVCAEGTVCSPDGTRCAVPSQLTACEGQDEGAGCSFVGEPSGSCSGGVCLPVGCGNGVIEPQLSEVCDDGNRTSFDGCSADCTSAEMCGDGAVDTALGEQCDCGTTGQTVAGCTGPNSTDPGASCRPDCKLARCGDGTVDPDEICDDGNNQPGDGCRADCAGRWTAMASGTFANLQAVWGSSLTDVYAVGEEGTIVHYDGVKWTPVAAPTTPAPASYEDVWGAGGQVFAVGNTQTGTGRIDRLDGASFSIMNTFASGTYVSTVHGQSGANFWVGGSVNGSSTLLQHYLGGAWPSTNASCPGVTAGFASLWTDAGGKAWAANDNGELCVFNASTWAKAAAVAVRRVWGLSATELYGVNSGSGTALQTANGSTWTQIPGLPTAIRPDNVGGVAGDIVIVGADGSIIMFDGTAIRVEQAPLPFDLRDVWVHSKGHAFVVGDNGTILW